MRPIGILNAVQRRIAWVAFLLLAVQTPIAAKALTDDSWTMSLAVASLVAVVLLIDESYRGQKARRDQTPPADNA